MPELISATLSRSAWGAIDAALDNRRAIAAQNGDDRLREACEAIRNAGGADAIGRPGSPLEVEVSLAPAQWALVERSLETEVEGSRILGDDMSTALLTSALRQVRRLRV